VEGLGPVAAAAAAFVGTHFLLSHPLRKPIVDTVGSAAFLYLASLRLNSSPFLLMAEKKDQSSHGALPNLEPAKRVLQ
jgi:hypothetical protein